MREDRPSTTAAWVATMRGLAPWLPDGGQLASDPLGLEFAPAWTRPFTTPLAARLLLRRGFFARMTLWLQLRTRALDDLVLAFAARGGRQLVLLGAGFDCRGSRLRGQIPGGVVFEIDHPATQRRKREVLGRLGVPSLRSEFLSWNFERPTAELPAQLKSLGHDPEQPTFTIWEGVTPYLSEGAIAATVAAVRDWSRSAESQLGFTYVEPRARRRWLQQSLVSLAGEPWRFGWNPAEVPAWMAAHGMRLVQNQSDAELAKHFLPPSLASQFGNPGRHVALATPL